MGRAAMEFEFDPNELERSPVPDWGLMCPQCRYMLRGLTSRICPECGAPFLVADLIRTWTRTHPPRFSAATRPVPDYGIRCAGCRAPLAGAAGSRCVQCAESFDLTRVQPARAWFLADDALARPVDLLSLAVLIEAEAIPYYAQSGKTFTDLVLGRVAFGANLVIPSEFYFDVRFLIRRTAQEIEQRRTQPETEWPCAACNERNPDHFEVCWNCGAARSGPQA